MVSELIVYKLLHRMCLRWRGKRRPKFSQPHKQTDEGLRKLVEDKVDAENM